MTFYYDSMDQCEKLDGIVRELMVELNRLKLPYVISIQKAFRLDGSANFSEHVDMHNTVRLIERGISPQLVAMSTFTRPVEGLPSSAQAVMQGCVAAFNTLRLAWELQEGGKAAAPETPFYIVAAQTLTSGEWLAIFGDTDLAAARDVTKTFENARVFRVEKWSDVRAMAEVKATASIDPDTQKVEWVSVDNSIVPLGPNGRPPVTHCLFEVEDGD